MACSSNDASPASSYTSSTITDENSEDIVEDTFWSGLARKAKAVLEERSSGSKQKDSKSAQRTAIPEALVLQNGASQGTQGKWKNQDSVVLHKGFEAIASSLSLLSDTLGNALEGGLNLVETKATTFMYTESRKRSLKQSREAISEKYVTDVPKFHFNVEKSLSSSSFSSEGKAVRSHVKLEEKIVRSHKPEEKIVRSQVKPEEKIVRSQVKPEEKPAVTKDTQLKASQDNRETISEKYVMDVPKFHFNIEKSIATSSFSSEGKAVRSHVNSEEKIVRSQVKPEEKPAVPQDTQLKASRDVAMAMATKAKLLLRELKDVKSDLACTKARCEQLEKENKRLRENVHMGERHEEDDLVRLQLEALLAEKARLIQENSTYARENQFLHEIVQYHQFRLRSIGFADETLMLNEECPLGASAVDMDFLPLYPEEKDIIALEESVKIANQHAV